MSFQPLESYEELKKSKIKVSPVLEWHLFRVINSIHRKIIFRQKFRNPWCVEVVEFIHKDIYYQFFRAVRDYHITYGRTETLVCDKSGHPKEYNLKFTHFGAFSFHFEKATNKSVDIRKLFKKSNAIGNIAEIEISEEKPATVDYKIKTGAMTIKLHYSVKNKFGNVCSF